MLLGHGRGSEPFQKLEILQNSSASVNITKRTESVRGNGQSELCVLFYLRRRAATDLELICFIIQGGIPQGAGWWPYLLLRPRQFALQLAVLVCQQLVLSRERDEAVSELLGQLLRGRWMDGRHFRGGTGQTEE